MALVLVVDTEQIVITFIRVALECKGHCVMTASSKAEACGTASKIERLEVLVIEPHLRTAKGRDIAETLLLTHPQMKILQISGWPHEHMDTLGSLLPGAAFLGKPFRSQQIQAAVMDLLGG